MRPLEGIRVLEVGQLLAGPFAGCLLGYFGAEVIKVEAPGQGDPIRQWRLVHDGTSLWWRSLARNKKCITLDLRTEQGQDIARRLAGEVDVLIENFKPGTMERWGLGPDDLAGDGRLIYTRISGYGQTGPYSDRPGFASVCEAVGGLRFLSGFPGDIPTRHNLSLGDSLAGMHAAMGVLLALLQRERGDGEGQTVDVAITESVFNMLEAVIPEYDFFGEVRQPAGTTITGIVPTNAYRCRDGRLIVLGANSDSIFKRLMIAIDRPELAEDSRFASNPGRVERQAELDDVLAVWAAGLDASDVIDRLTKAGVPVGPVNDVRDIMTDPHFRSRDLFEQVDVDGWPTKVPAILPKLDRTPGRTTWAGADLGAHNDEVYGGLLGLSDDEIEALRVAEVI
ncbi:MAG: CaiB/BaiF CoA-transferase family protein [Acidobacteriota bacterium]